MSIDIEEVWEDLQKEERDGIYYRLIYPDLLNRAYIGVEGIPYKRLAVFEIPEKFKDKYERFDETKGISFHLAKTGQEQDGFISCVLSSASHDQNDVFTVFVEDVIEALLACCDQNSYSDALIKRTNKWKNFFLKKTTDLLSEMEIQGLFGEVCFINEMISEGVTEIEKMWAGPLKKAQDFQSENFAVEIKTTGASTIDLVRIANPAQLDNSGIAQLYLCVYRLEEDVVNGTTLPELITEVEKGTTEREKQEMESKLFAYGYNSADQDRYTRKYIVREKKVFSVTDDFPKLNREMIPAEITDVKYTLHLKECGDFETEWCVLVDNAKELLTNGKE